MSAPDKHIGEVFEQRYRMIRLIGEGGMGVVYEAEHVVVGRRVAVKMLHPDMARDESIVQRFYNEARAAGSVGSEHIVEVLDFGWSGAPYLVMEFLEGQSLKDILRAEGPVDPDRACRWLIQVLDGVGAAHEKGIIHRDLKPENIFVSRKGGKDLVKIVDFGISKLHGDKKTKRLTQTGSLLGTPFYMSPEQALGAKDIDGRTDIWSAGVVLYESTVGRLPFPDENYNILLVKIISENPPAPTSVNPHLPKAIEDIILKAMAREREHRFRTCAEFSAAVQAFLDGRPTGVVAAPQSPSQIALRVAAARSKILETAARPASTAGVAAPTPAPAGAPTALTSSAQPTAATTTGGTAASRRSLAPYAAAMAVALALAVAVWLGFLRGGGDEQGAPPPTPRSPAAHASPPARPTPGAETAGSAPILNTSGSVSSAAPAPSPPAAVPAPAGAAIADTVRFEVSATPVAAKIYLDGIELPGNPVALRFRKDGVARTLRITAEGFLDKSQIVSFDADVVVTVSLEPRPAENAGSRPDTRGSSPDAATARDAVSRQSDRTPARDVDSGGQNAATRELDAGTANPPALATLLTTEPLGYREVTIDAGRLRPDGGARVIEGNNPYR